MATRVISSFVTRNRAVLLLTAVALATRLPLLSISLDEVDSANFYNALNLGYNITWIRPQAPGYPVYVFMGWLLNSAPDDPLPSLTLLSAVLGSLAVVPFYLLLRELADSRIALVGSLLFLVNPLLWSFSEVALSDVPSMSIVVFAAWLTYRGRRSNAAFLSACVVMSLAIGVRQSNIPLVVLLAFPVGYRSLVTREFPWKLSMQGAGLFALASSTWFFSAVFMGTAGFSEYLAAFSKQYSAAVRVYDFTQVEPSWGLNHLYSVERFFVGYFVTYAWTGSDDKTPATILLSIPWLFGFAMFVTAFRFRSASHVFVALWLATVAYQIVAIHFLSRYGLAQLPGFIIACLLGYRLLASELLRHPRRFQVISIAGIGTVLLMYGLKYEPPVGAFESTPPDTEAYALVFVGLGLLVLLFGRWVALRYRPPPEPPDTPPESGPSQAHYTTVLVSLALLVLPYAVNGYGMASLAHRAPSPSQRMVDFVIANFDVRQVTPCWDAQTHSFFEAFAPAAAPVGYGSVEELYRAHEDGSHVDVCPPDGPVHHEVQILPDGNVMYLSRDVRLPSFGDPTAPQEGDTIGIWDQVAGSAEIIWNIFDFISPRQRTLPSSDFTLPGQPVWGGCDRDETVQDWSHGNSVFMADDGSVLASFRHLNQVISIAPDFESTEWRLGGPGSDFTFPDPSDRFYHQHTAVPLPDGNVLLFDNGNRRPQDEGGEYSRALELELDFETMTARMVWEYRHRPDIFARCCSVTYRLENGNTLILFGTQDVDLCCRPFVIVEADPEGNAVWEVEHLSPGKTVQYRVYPSDAIMGEVRIEEG